MASENLEEMFQLIKYNLRKENTEIRELIPPRIGCQIGFLSTGEWYKSDVYEHCSFYSTMNSSAFTSLSPFFFSIYSSLIKKPSHMI